MYGMLPKRTDNVANHHYYQTLHKTDIRVLGDYPLE
jgi:hypothetical protein